MSWYLISNGVNYKVELEDKVVKDKFILTKVYGNSMFPTLRSGSKIIAKKISFLDLKPFDIIIFKKGIFKVCHRILNIDNKRGLIYTKGDFSPWGAEEIKEEDILGKVIAVIFKDKIYPLKWQRIFLYYQWITLIGLLKELATFSIDKLYSLSLLRRFLKKLSFSYVSCLVAKNENDMELFNGLYNFLPEQLYPFSISERILSFYKGRFIAKLWVLKDQDNNFWLWGPYVKVLYRAKGIGTDLVKKALKIIFQTDTSASVYVLTPLKKSLLKFYAKFGFAPEGPSCGLSFNFVTLKNFKKSSVNL